MKILATGIPDLYVIEPTVFEDGRGWFYESYNKQQFEDAGLQYDFVQDNASRSTYGVLRGLHYQLAPYAQAKLVRVMQGEVWDVVVDIRKGSPTYGKWHGEILSAENKKQVLVPRGFAHGFVVLSETAEFCYKCDNFYKKEAEGGLVYNDPSVNIDWKIDRKDIILSDRDKNFPTLEHAANNFEYLKNTALR